MMHPKSSIIIPLIILIVIYFVLLISSIISVHKLVQIDENEWIYYKIDNIFSYSVKHHEYDNVAMDSGLYELNTDYCPSSDFDLFYLNLSKYDKEKTDKIFNLEVI